MAISQIEKMLQTDSGTSGHAYEHMFFPVYMLMP